MIFEKGTSDAMNAVCGCRVRNTAAKKLEQHADLASPLIERLTDDESLTVRAQARRLINVLKEQPAEAPLKQVRLLKPTKPISAKARERTTQRIEATIREKIEILKKQQKQR